jgi:hypothetical protein
MIEKIGSLSESMATRVSLSRRGFLGRLGQGALVAASAVSGLLLLSGDVRADSKNCPCQRQPYKCPPGKECLGGCHCERVF